MKRAILKLMVILAAAMMLCGSTFALSYGCSCGSTSSSAYTQSDAVVSNISASFDGWVWRGAGGYLSISNAHYNAGTYASCSRSYSYALQGEIDSSHEADSFSATSYDSFGMSK